MTGSDINLEAPAHKRLDEEARLQAEEINDLHDRLASFEALFEHLPVGVTYFDTEMRVLYANAKYEQLLGTPRDTAIGRIVYDVSDVARERRPLFERALTGETNTYRYTPYQHPDGSSRHYEVAHAPVRDKNGKIIGLISTINDVTEQYEAERKVRESEARLRTMARSVPSIIWEATPSGTISFHNEQWLQYTGLTPEQNAQNWAELAYHPDDYERCVTAWKQALDTGEDYEVEVRNRRFDGVYRWFLTRAVPVRNDEGKITSWAGSTTDIHENKLLEEALYASEARLTAILEQLPVGVSVYDSEGQTVLLNSVMRRFLGEAMPSRDPERMHQWRSLKSDGTLLPPDEWPDSRALRGEKVVPGVEFLFTDDEGYETWTYITAVPLRDGEGRIVGAIAVVQDISARKQDEQRKDEFMALASHEMRTPLTAIKGFSQSLLRSLAATEISDERTIRMKRALHVINTKTDLLNQLINDMLDVSRIERSELSLQQESFDLAQLVNQVVSNQSLSAQDFEFTSDIPPHSVLVNGDRQRIEQVVTNLIDNAVKYSADSRKVDVRVEAHPNEAVVSVTDYGMGIPAYEQERVFERYFQATNVTVAHHSGLGLGLYISHGIIDRHGGRMWLKSAVGQGSTFYFALPSESV
jgi:PAS domain S-box-containing protein